MGFLLCGDHIISPCSFSFFIHQKKELILMTPVCDPGTRKVGRSGEACLESQKASKGPGDQGDPMSSEVDRCPLDVRGGCSHNVPGFLH